MLCDAMIDKPKRKASRLGTFGEVLYSLSPKTVDIVLNTAYNLFPDSKAAKGKKEGAAELAEGRRRRRRQGRGDVDGGRGDGLPVEGRALLAPAYATPAASASASAVTSSAPCRMTADADGSALRRTLPRRPGSRRPSAGSCRARARRARAPARGRRRRRARRTRSRSASQNSIRHFDGSGTVPERAEPRERGREREEGRAQRARPAAGLAELRVDLLAAHHGHRHDRRAGAQRQLHEAAAPEALQPVALGEGLAGALDALGEHGHELVLLQQPQRVVGRGHHAADPADRRSTPRAARRPSRAPGSAGSAAAGARAGAPPTSSSRPRAGCRRGWRPAARGRGRARSRRPLAFTRHQRS